MYRTLRNLSGRLLHAGLLATLVAIAAAAAPRPAEATLLCRRGGDCVEFNGGLDFCNHVTQRVSNLGPDVACFMLSTNPGAGSGGAGSHLLRHANGEVSLVADGRRSSIVIASAAGEKQLADFLAKISQSPEPGQPAAQRTEDRGRRGG
ncbi:MAG: hypothetical protein FJX74_25560, partial [Armatimonadetes bacterium]|nr:hypothetical protein [Armatimonadota bacterium]